MAADALDLPVDPSVPRALALITHAHGDHIHPLHERVLCTPETAVLIRRRVSKRTRIEAVPYGARFRVGEAEISFHHAGHILGSAQIRAEQSGEVTVFTGDFKRAPDPTCEPFELVRCDTLVCETTFADARHAWPDTASVIGEMRAWLDDNRARRRASCLVCYAMGKAQRVLKELAPFLHEPPLVHRSIANINESYAELGVVLPACERLQDQRPRAFAGRVVLAPPGVDSGRFRARLGACSTAFVTGWARDPERVRRYDRAFQLSDHADWNDLRRTIEETGARRVIPVHGDQLRSRNEVERLTLRSP